MRRFPGTPTDAALVAALQARRPGASAMLLERYGSYVERLIVRVLGLDAEVPDLINEVFVRALERVEQIREPAALKGWLGSVAIFTTRVFIRDRRSRRRFLGFFAPEDLPDVPALSTPPEVSQALSRTYQILAKLPADERIAFALRFVDGMGLAEVATMTSVSIGTVKRRVSRAQARFASAASRDPVLKEHFSKDEPWGQL